MAIKHLPNMRQGDDYTVEIKYPIGTNITGFKFYLTLKASFDDLDAAAILQYSQVVGDNILDDALNGVLFFSVPASITATVAAGSYYYDFQQISIGGQVETLMPPIDDHKHKLIVIPQVTRATV